MPEKIFEPKQESKLFSFGAPVDLVERFDKLAKKYNTNRTDMLIQLMQYALNNEAKLDRLNRQKKPKKKG